MSPKEAERDGPSAEQKIALRGKQGPRQRLAREGLFVVIPHQ